MTMRKPGKKGQKKFLAGGHPSGITQSVSKHVYIRPTMKNMKSLAKICLVLLTAVTLAAFTTQAQTDSSSASTNTPPPATPRPKSKRYIGKITSVDTDAPTITITLASGASQTIHITSKTRIRKDHQPATLADVAVGSKVFGAEHQDESKNWVATTLNIGEPRTTAAPAAPAAPPAADKPQ
jgi:hypothetical protein